MGNEADRIVLAVDKLFKERVVQEAAKRKLSMAAYVRFALEKLLDMPENEQSRYIADGLVLCTSINKGVTVSFKSDSYKEKRLKSILSGEKT